MMKAMNEAETRSICGGAKKVYYCKVCGYKSTSMVKTFSNAWACGVASMGRFASNVTKLFDVADFIEILTK